LTPQSQQDPRVVDGPYSSSMITETARHREIQNVYATASTETRIWYDRAIMNDGGWDNWIIRWCLWHVFRYRDDRNRHNRRSPTGDTRYVQAPTYHQPYRELCTVSMKCTATPRRPAAYSPSIICADQYPIERTIYDPVYDQVRFY
jgi:hypothetical protein